MCQVEFVGTYAASGTSVTADFVESGDFLEGLGVSDNDASTACFGAAGVAAVTCLLRHYDKSVGIYCCKLRSCAEGLEGILALVNFACEGIVIAHEVDGAVAVSKPFLVEPEHTLGVVDGGLALSVFDNEFEGELCAATVGCGVGDVGFAELEGRQLVEVAIGVEGLGCIDGAHGGVFDGDCKVGEVGIGRLDDGVGGNHRVVGYAQYAVNDAIEGDGGHGFDRSYFGYEDAAYGRVLATFDVDVCVALGPGGDFAVISAIAQDAVDTCRVCQVFGGGILIVDCGCQCVGFFQADCVHAVGVRGEIRDGEFDAGRIGERCEVFPAVDSRICFATAGRNCHQCRSLDAVIEVPGSGYGCSGNGNILYVACIGDVWSLCDAAAEEQVFQSALYRKDIVGDIGAG